MNELNRQKPFSDLTARQLQILKLLQAGKPNKELSEELGIGLGTVKQHLVALFKKLKVKNRAMAVSLAIDIQQEQETPRLSSLRTTILLDRRPCVVLSVSLPQDANLQAVRLMHGSLAAIAAANDAIFLARSGNAGDVIFGIQRSTEYVIAIALQTAQAMHGDLLAADADMASQLRGCLTAGHAFASMQRFGGWTGEALASSAISSARELLDTVAPGYFAIDSSARGLTALFGIEGLPEDTDAMPLHNIEQLRWSANRPGYELTGRIAEMTKLYAALEKSVLGHGKLFHIEGEMGMGKSRLCEEIFRLCPSRSAIASFYRCLPAALGQRYYDTSSREYCAIEDIDARLRAQPGRLPELVIVDDIHLLPATQQAMLASAAATAVQLGKLVVFAGRKVVRATDASPAEVIGLRRLPPQSLQGLVRKALRKEGGGKNRTNTVLNICSEAAGVPLFAIELARHHKQDKQLPLTLQIAINARLDGLHLDRGLLREVAKQTAGISLEDAAQNMGENIESVRQQASNSVAAGVLSLTADEWISFTHPLLRLAINDTITD
ncbi:MAG: LuxR C-terminal-related transcriptional regulator [Gallionella sp.]